MPTSYDLKVVVSGKQVEVFKYTKSIWRDFEKRINTSAPKEQKKLTPSEQADLQQQKMKFSLSRTKTEIRRLTNANSQLNKFLTLTFAKNITDLKTANYIFNQFVKRISYQYPNFEYIAVPEFQKRGAVHYHLLCKLPFVHVRHVQDIWRQGNITLNRIDKVNNVGAYICKYLGKAMFDERMHGKKKFFRSQTLSEAVELLGVWAMNFVNKFLTTLTPVFERTFSSDWTGEVVYKAYSLDFLPAMHGMGNFESPEPI